MKIQTRHTMAAALLTVSLLAGCNTQIPSTAAPAPQTETVVGKSALPMPNWKEQSIYFVLTDRFHNGNTSNDNGTNSRPGDAKDLSNPMGWHGGDLAGLKQKIESGYFNQMGFTAIWLTPVYLQVPPVLTQDGPNKGRYHAGYAGYWAEDFFQVDPHLGTLQDYKDLIAAAHAKGLYVIQDMVVNHAGYEANLFKTKPGWFHSMSCPTWNDITCPLAGLPDFNQQNTEVRNFLNDSTRFWVDQTGIDGIRMDTMKHVYDDYWPQYFAAGGPADVNKVWTVGEVFDYGPDFVSKYLRLGSPSVFDFPLQQALVNSLGKRGSLDAVAGILAQDSKYPDAARLTTFLDNHDKRRFMSEGIEVGVPEGEMRERLDAATSLMYMVRGTPSIYYGTEIYMQGKGDPYNYPSGQTNREDMNFSAASTSPFTTRLTKLNQARKTYKALTGGAYTELWRPNGGTNLFAFSRTLTGQPSVMVLVNGSDQSIDLTALGGIGSGGALPANASVTEITGKAHNLTVNSTGKVLGNIPARSVLAITSGGSTCSTVAFTPTPTNFAGTAGNASVALKWDAINDCRLKGFTLEYKATSATTYTGLVSLPATATNYTYGNLLNGTNYTFRLTAKGTAADVPVTTTATPNVPAAIDIYFKKPAAWATPNIHFWNVVASPAIAGSTWPGVAMPSFCAPWHKYSFPATSSLNLLFVNSANLTQKTVDLTRTTTGWYDGNTNTWTNTRPAPSNPGSFTSTAGNARVTLNWTAANDCVTGYKIFRKTSAQTAYPTTPLATVTGTTLTFADTTVVNGTTYNYRIVATAASGDSAGLTTTATPTGTTTTGITVYFKKPWSWGKANIHFWNVSASPAIANTTWPGVTMALESGDWYRYTFANATAANLLFVDGNNTTVKTPDLSRTTTGWYDGNNGTWYNTKPSDDLTVHVRPPSTWTKVNIHFWNVAANPAIANSTWPGVTMVSEGNGWYKYTFPKAISANLLFVNGDNTTQKTPDLFRNKEGWYDVALNRWTDTQP
ncbi:alpha-amylase family glycosyl hydrolase [Deinococcus misasensis]|uniref:alpha-amylase family glycosyl hydrolase n=1 Tax=Deinococcus misasensis TaxID=392413 RepID=UPI00068AB5AB|nr:alpha-amylase family glycosyl hydrolase [Deinococcus misasensis]